MTDRDELDRPYDEEFDTMMEVQKNPTGAWMAIQQQADTIEALRQRAEAADRDRSRMYDAMATLQADLTEARAQAAAAWEAGRDAAAGWMQQRLDDYISECGLYDGTTGVTEFPGNGDEWVCEQEEAIEAIRALTPPADASAALTARLDAEWNSAIDAAADKARRYVHRNDDSAETAIHALRR